MRNKNIERGLYFEIDELPFSCAVDFNDLKKNIMMFNKKEYYKNVASFMQSLGYEIIDNSAKKIAEFIYEDVNNEKTN